MHTQQYEWAVDALARKNVDSLFSNGKPEHARIIFNKFFCNAKKEVRIYSGSLMCRRDGIQIFSWDPLIESAKEFLRKSGTSLKVLLENELDKDCDNGFYSKLTDCGFSTDSLEFRTFNAANKGKFGSHFAVMDTAGFRIEVNDIKTEALANFNNPKIAKRLVKSFDREFGCASPLVVNT
jgi:hypothetical protein